jgi:hypothetical protein
MNCARCEGTGFLNAEQIPQQIQEGGAEVMRHWCAVNKTDAQVCDCCGDGDGRYGEPGQHHTSIDPVGKDGPYAYNGGLCECH